MTNPCAPSNLNEMEAKSPRFPMPGAVKREINEHRCTFPATYMLLLLASSMCRILGSNTQVLSKDMAVKRVDLEDDVSTGWARDAAEVEKWHTYSMASPLCCGECSPSAPSTICAGNESCAWRLLDRL